ncbi:mechanosensitive ion channel family protein [Pontibacter diazotrophicus]|uniref:mechanosensitive ion channel family protein n=1 Tax=Pontibacter diazotrophicus TaxID=1400979 RepID=UPI001FEA7D69|nr:mechanosensitive ion channel family protein [Pontibacter diazotrophicus]
MSTSSQISKKLFRDYSWLFFIICSVLALQLPITQAHAQLLSTDTTNNTEQAEPEWANDSLGRRTPRGTVEGFIKAVANEDYDKAAQFLRLDPDLQDDMDGAALAQSLQRLLDQNGRIFPYSQISNDPGGLEDDNLGPNLDRVGTATVNGETFNVILEKTEGPDGGPIWLFSSQTVQRVPLLTEEEATGSVVDRLSPRFLRETKWGGVPIAHWMAMLLLVIGAYLLAWSITSFTLYTLRLLWYKARQEATAGIIRAFALPIKIYLAVWLFVVASEQVGVSIIVRQRFSEVTIIVGVAAILLLIWRLLDATTRFTERRLTRRNNMAGVSAVLFLRRAAKIAIVVLGFIAILDTVGVDVTAGLAALGIGGIALALGAQKTVENFVGSVTLIADQPLRVGDFCKVGDIVGTVEQIGMRSTRIRTLARTIVTIPNGELASTKIENYAHRDRFWFHPTFGLRFESTPDQLRFLLVELRAILYAHPKVSPTPARVRFIEIGADSLNIEIFAYILAKDFDQFLEVQEDLYLRMMDIVEASGTGFAFPSQTLYIARDQGLSKEKGAEAEEQVRKWREAGEMQIPSFNSDRIQNLRNSISYPPEGSSQQNGRAT